MRRLISLLCFICSTGLYAAPDYPPAEVDMVLQKVGDHSYFVQGVAGVATDNQGFVSNAGVVITAQGIVVFDALGTPSLAIQLLELVRQVSDQPIVKVIVSHYHADHIYGLQVFKDLGAEIWAPAGAHDYLTSPNAEARLEERRISLYPWVNDDTRLVEPDRYIDAAEQFEVGGVEFNIVPVGAANSDGDLTLYAEDDRVLFSGDIIFGGRIPFVGDADSGHWLQVLETMERDELKALVPGHGEAASDPNRSISTMRRYLAYLRDTMGAAAQDLVPFDEAYAAADWSAFENLPAFEEANRRNAYQVYLSMEAELLQ